MLKSLWVKQVRKPVPPDIPGAQPWSRAPGRASRAHVAHLPTEEAWPWVCPGCRARLKAGCVCRGCCSQPCPRTEHSLRPQPGPVHTAAGSPVLMLNQTPQSNADPSLLTLKPVGTSGQLDLTSAGRPLPCPLASTASRSLWTSCPLLLLWLGPPPRPAWPPGQRLPTIRGPSEATGTLGPSVCAKSLASCLTL